MNGQEFRELIKRKRVILDGATGSNLLAAGMPRGVCPEQWILEHPEVLIGLQTEYLRAGTDILYAPTFSGNRIKLAEYGLAGRLEEMNRRLTELSREAVRRAGREGSAYVAADLTMTGRQLAPVGTMDFEELVDVYKEQVRCCVSAGADLIVIETMMSLQECRAALLAAKEVCSLPVMVTLTFREDGHTFNGNTPETAAIVLGGMGADAVGMNCSTGPDRLLGLVERMAAVSEVPVAVKPNAGLPVLRDGRTVYDMGPERFAECMDEVLRAGASIVGGCCGTTPEYIRLLAERAAGHTPLFPESKGMRVLATERSVLPVELDGRFLVIGERINPTGKKALQEELRAGSMELVRRMAEEQAENGADILDIN
ncbi:MAG: homocysteine S-methyltransferase family protein, partial [Lachnospiraceae bacterium]|nr:homocysteine S-methyltransferase family protein [Lachnospiraceae bacterium]